MWTKDVPELLALVFELVFGFICPLHRKEQAHLRADYGNLRQAEVYDIEMAG